MHKLEIKLKQHTPMIHFQSDQEGATLRATEVKPKLDRFILRKLGENADVEKKDRGRQQWRKERDKHQNSTDPIYTRDFDELTDRQKGYRIAKALNWLVGSGEHMALDYKMKITCTGEVDLPDIKNEKSGEKKVMPYPLFFGNLNKDKDDKTENKKYSWTDALVNFCVQSFKSDFIYWLKSNPKILNNFFLQTNFGTRQSKGFGSFGIDQKVDKKTNPFGSYPYLVITKTKTNECTRCWLNLFKDLDLFYKFLRGGINQQGFYMKPFIFWYMKDYMGYNWEKRFVKKTYFDKPCVYKEKGQSKKMESLEEQMERHQGEDSPLYLENDNYRLIRDLFGLSTTASWKHYGNARIEKIDVNEEIERFPSPFIFKILEGKEDGRDVYYVGIVLNPDVIESFEENLRGHEFSICCKVNDDVCDVMNKNGLNVRKDRNDNLNILSGENISFPQELLVDKPDITFEDFWIDFFQKLKDCKEKIMSLSELQQAGLGTKLKTILAAYQYNQSNNHE